MLFILHPHVLQVLPVKAAPSFPSPLLLFYFRNCHLSPTLYLQLSYWSSGFLNSQWVISTLEARESPQDANLTMSPPCLNVFSGCWLLSPSTFAQHTESWWSGLCSPPWPHLPMLAPHPCVLLMQALESPVSDHVCALSAWNVFLLHLSKVILILQEEHLLKDFPDP